MASSTSSSSSSSVGFSSSSSTSSSSSSSAFVPFSYEDQLRDNNALFNDQTYVEKQRKRFYGLRYSFRGPNHYGSQMIPELRGKVAFPILPNYGDEPGHASSSSS